MWRQLHRILRDAIASGEVPVGSPLPSKRVIAQENGVSDTTIDAALAELKREGLVEPERGKGMYVIKKPRP